MWHSRSFPFLYQKLIVAEKEREELYKTINVFSSSSLFSPPLLVSIPCLWNVSMLTRTSPKSLVTQLSSLLIGSLRIQLASSWSQLLETLPLPNIKWICPTAPTRSVAIFGGFPCTAWFDAGDISEDAPDDLEGLDASAAHVANLLSTEPADIKLGVGGFSMGAATTLYSATCHVLGQYGNGNLYPVNLSAIVGLSGWLPCSRTLRNRMERSDEAARLAASLPILLCHGSGDDVVAHKHGEKSAQALSSAGFQNLMFRSYNGLGHYTIPEEMDEVCNWLITRLGLDGPRS